MALLLLAASGSALAQRFPGDTFGIFPLYGSYSGNGSSLTEAEALAQLMELKVQIGENRGSFRVGFNGIYGGESTLDRNCRLARDNNMSHAVIINVQTHSLPTSVKNIANADLRNYQWRKDGVTWQGVDSADSRDWEVVTPSRYATALWTEFERIVRNDKSKPIKRQMDNYPGIIVSVNASVEEELATGGITSNNYLGDYSPCATMEFRDWLRHTGIYDADTGTYPAEGAPAAITGTYVMIAGKLRSPFYDDPTPVNANGTGTSFNGTFSTGFTTWTLKNWDLTAYPAAITDINFDPTPASGNGFTAGGFDAPRTVSATNAFWKAWSWDYQDQGNTYPTGNPTAPAFGFRQTMLRNFVNDVMAWIKAEGIPGDVITAHQIPTEMVSAERNRSSASPIWTGLSKINGTVGLTRYGSTSAAQVALITQYTNNWGYFEWHVKPNETDNVVLHDRAVTDLARFYSNNCRIVCPFSWATGVGGVGAGIPYPVKGCGFAAGIKEWMDAQVAIYTPTVSSVGDQTVNESTATSVLSFTIGDDTTPPGSLIVTVASSNTALVPVANIVLGGSGANRTVTVTPVTNLSGTATITVTVSDGTFTTTTAFLITVNAVSDSRIKGPTGTQLNLGATWSAGIVPLDPDVAIWDSTSRTGSFTPGGALNWGGLTILNPTAPITFNGTSALTLGSAGVNLSAATTDLTVNFPLVLGANQSWSVAASRALTANGVISGSGTLTKTGAGMVALSGINTFTGAVTVSSGPLRVANSAAFGTNNKTVSVSNGTSGQCQLLLDGSAGNVALPASVTLNTSMQTLTGAIVNEAGDNSIAGPISMISGGGSTLVTVLGGSLALNGTITANVSSGRVLILAGSGSNAVNGVIRDGSGAASVTVQGGTWTLSAPNTCTGATTVSGGTLNLTGSLASAVTVSGGVLSGTGTVSGNVTINGGTHAPGNSAGIMALNGNYTLGSGGALQIEINGPAVGTQYDQVKLAGAAGTVTLAGALNVVAAGGLAAGATFTIIEKTSAGAVSGAFAGKANGSAFVASGYTWIISYTGGDGNDVTLTVATPQQAWRFTYFATIANTGAAADTADPNGDGENNFLEFATAQNPNAATTTATPLVRNGTTLEFTYTCSLAALSDGVTFTVEWSDTLATNSWSTAGVTEQILTNNGTVQTVKATLPAGAGGKRFVHLRMDHP